MFLFIASTTTFVIPTLLSQWHGYDIDQNMAWKYIIWLVACSPTYRNMYQQASFIWTVMALSSWRYMNPVLVSLSLSMGTLGMFKQLEDRCF